MLVLAPMHKAQSHSFTHLFQFTKIILMHTLWCYC